MMMKTMIMMTMKMMMMSVVGDHDGCFISSETIETDILKTFLFRSSYIKFRGFLGLTGSAVDHRSEPPEFKSPRGHV